jgi:crossover junction endodeoxyribonuclease RuvC
VTVTVLGLDLSLTSTGAAAIGGFTGSQADTTRLRPPPKFKGHTRLLWLQNEIADLARDVPLVVVEGPSYASTGRGQHERAGLWWLVTHHLWATGVPLAVVPPSNLKRYATGKGNAGKDDVLREVTKRFPWFAGGNDEADALVLAAMGADHLGHPLTPMPATHRTALDGVDWPAPTLEATR